MNSLINACFNNDSNIKSQIRKGKKQECIHIAFLFGQWNALKWGKKKKKSIESVVQRSTIPFSLVL